MELYGIKAFKKINIRVHAVIISVHEGSKFIFEALCAGAVGYLSKNIETARVTRFLKTSKKWWSSHE